ncbi:MULTISPECIES: peptide deformylase [unclassified Microbacterium]|uniref:peptide deformylase n=1 Tax=unclassified Microbacterium TaxID=2609290 RepID=UPI001D74A3B8|nr:MULTISPECIES: peptide deformylase [unclassified Microbacterium]CAH0162566.1 Peptide deformylase [Microbacterium sp. Bi121]HWK78725.1 peptide deformylase [Microbacterium sp.]
MAVLPIRIMGDPVLHSPASPVEEITDEIRTLVADMFETMDAAPGVGLAAPQVGEPLRIYTYSYVDDDDNPWRGVIINPVLWMSPPEPGSPDPEEESEGCLSFPGERFALRRAERALVTGVDLDGADVRIEVDGWRARIMQHEFDHLDGILYIDRLDDGDWKTVQKIARKRGWGRPGASWVPGVDDLEG